LVAPKSAVPAFGPPLPLEKARVKAREKERVEAREKERVEERLVQNFFWINPIIEIEMTFSHRVVFLLNSQGKGNGYTNQYQHYYNYYTNRSKSSSKSKGREGGKGGASYNYYGYGSGGMGGMESKRMKGH